MDKILNIMSNYAYIIVWVIIFLLLWLDRKGKDYYKYEQRDENNPYKNKKFKIRKIKYNDFPKQLKIWFVFFSVLLVLLGLTTIIFLIVYGCNKNLISFIDKLCVSFLVGYILVVELLIKFCYVYDKNKIIFRGSWIIYVLALYCIVAYSKTYFVDFLVIAATLALVYMFNRSRYKYGVLMLVLGLNLIVIGEKFLVDIQPINNIINAIGTGIIVSGICYVFTQIEDKKKKLIERNYEIDTIMIFIESVMEEMYNSYHVLLGCEEECFEYAKYDEFKDKMLAYLSNEETNIIDNFDDELESMIIGTKQQMAEVYKDSKYFQQRGIFNEDEIWDLECLYGSTKGILKSLDESDNENLKQKLKLFINVSESLRNSMPEFEDAINQFGKDKIYAEHELFTGKLVWPDGAPVKIEDCYLYEKSNKKDL